MSQSSSFMLLRHSGTAYRRLSLVLSLLVLVSFASASTAEPNRAVDPGINAYYLDTTAERWMDIFESNGREVFDRRHEILDVVGLRPGMSVADVGAGTGLFTILFAEAVGPEGKVYAVDISPGFIAAIERRAAQSKLRNVTAILNTQQHSGLAPQSVDLVFICDTYHHFEFPAAMLASINEALKPGGSLIIIDFRRILNQSSRWILSHVRSGRGQVIDEVQRAGFELSATEDILSTNYLLRFRKHPPELSHRSDHQ